MSAAILSPLHASAKSIIGNPDNRRMKLRRRRIWRKSSRSTQDDRRISSVQQLSWFIVQVVVQDLHKER
jgi:hypothetical protein